MSRESIKAISEAYKSVLTLKESLTGDPSDDAKMMPYRIETKLAPAREEYISFDSISMAEKVGHPNLTGLDRQYWADFFVRNQQEFPINSVNPDHITKPMPVDSNLYDIPSEVEAELAELEDQGYHSIDYPRNVMRNPRDRKETISGNLTPEAKKIYSRDPSRNAQKNTLFVAPAHSSSLDPISNHAPELKPRGKVHPYLKCSDMAQARGCEFVIPGSHGAIFFMLTDDSDKKAQKPSVVYILKPYYTTRGIVQYGVYKIKGRRDPEVDRIVKNYITHTNGMKITRNLYDVFENPEFAS